MTRPRVGRGEGIGDRGVYDLDDGMGRKERMSVDRIDVSRGGGRRTRYVRRFSQCCHTCVRRFKGVFATERAAGDAFRQSLPCARKYHLFSEF